MPTAYKLEIFGRDFAAKDFTPIAAPKIDFDYTDLGKFDIPLPRTVDAARGDFARVSDETGTVHFEGIVDSLSIKKKTTGLSLRPLLALLDIKSAFDVNSQSVTVEALWRLIIRDAYTTVADTAQRLSSVFSISTDTAGSLTVEETIWSVWELAVQTLKRYGVVLTAALQPQLSRVRYGIAKAAPSGLVIEADQPNVIDCTIDLATYEGVQNKVTIINEEDTSETAVYYLHPDGSVNTTNSNRITPVIWDFQTITVGDGETFASAAEAAAKEALTPPEADDLIKVLMVRGDRLADPDSISIGQTATIIKSGVSYTGVLTGYIKDQNTVQLIFGTLRYELTKILAQKERKRK